MADAIQSWILFDRNLLTQELLKSVLHYDPLTGDFRWLARTVRPESSRTDTAFNAHFAGKLAGGLSYKGYIRIGVFSCHYTAHGLAWLYMTGRFPEKQIDHRDGNVANNRWDNLREATASQNQANTKKKSRKGGGTYSQYKGVEKCTATGKWVARICCNRKRTVLGRFHSELEAHLAYQKAAKEMFGEFARFS